MKLVPLVLLELLVPVVLLYVSLSLYTRCVGKNVSDKSFFNILYS